MRQTKRPGKKTDARVKTLLRMNARNDRSARYRERLTERLLDPQPRKLESTPEIERALNTPANELPVDLVLRGALRRSGTGNWLAHVRLAQMKRLARKRSKALASHRTRHASETHRARGEQSRSKVEIAARKLLKRRPETRRSELAKRISTDGSVALSEQRILSILKSLRLP